MSGTVPLRESLGSLAHIVSIPVRRCRVFILALYRNVCSFRRRAIPVPRAASEKRDRRYFVPHQIPGIRWPRGAHRDPRHRGGPRGPGHAGKSSPRLRFITRPESVFLPFKGPQILDVTGTPVSHLNKLALTYTKQIKLLKT